MEKKNRESRESFGAWAVTLAPSVGQNQDLIHLIKLHSDTDAILYGDGPAPKEVRLRRILCLAALFLAHGTLSYLLSLTVNTYVHGEISGEFAWLLRDGIPCRSKLMEDNERKFKRLRTQLEGTSLRSGEELGSFVLKREEVENFVRAEYNSRSSKKDSDFDSSPPLPEVLWPLELSLACTPDGQVTWSPAFVHFCLSHADFQQFITFDWELCYFRIAAGDESIPLSGHERLFTVRKWVDRLQSYGRCAFNPKLSVEEIVRPEDRKTVVDKLNSILQWICQYANSIPLYLPTTGRLPSHTESSLAYMFRNRIPRNQLLAEIFYRSQKWNEGVSCCRVAEPTEPIPKRKSRKTVLRAKMKSSTNPTPKRKKGSPNSANVKIRKVMPARNAKANKKKW